MGKSSVRLFLYFVHMKNNLISSLLKYASYRDKEPKENILSGAFAFILAEIPVCRSHFVKFILEKYKEEYPKEVFRGVKPSALQVETQCVHRNACRTPAGTDAGRDIVDIELDQGKEFGIFVECKFYSGLGHRQDTRYYSALKRKHKRGILVFLSPGAALELSDSVKAIQVSWREVYELFSGLRSSSATHIQKYLLSEFLGYLKEKNMAAFPGLKKTDALSDWANYHSSVARYKNLFSVLKEYLAKHGYEVGTLEKNVNNADMYYKIFPEQVKSSTRRFKKWKKSYKYIACGLYLYSREIKGADYNEDFQEGLYPYVQVWSSKSVRVLRNGSRLLSRNKFEVDEDGRNAINDTQSLTEVVHFSGSPKSQEKEFVRFYAKSIKVLERAGVIRTLCRM